VKMSKVASHTWRLVANESITAVQKRSKRSSVVSPATAPVPMACAIQDRGVTFYADPACRQAGQIYRKRGCRGTYFRDPDGHLMEILTPDA
jgi:catechol 2,3-dioxygenase-like lactoylglutathione lyase family enzyme